VAIVVECIYCKQFYNKENTKILYYADIVTKESKTVFVCVECLKIIST
jgi:hypothetical protein